VFTTEATSFHAHLSAETHSSISAVTVSALRSGALAVENANATSCPRMEVYRVLQVARREVSTDATYAIADAMPKGSKRRGERNRRFRSTQLRLNVQRKPMFYAATDSRSFALFAWRFAGAGNSCR